MPAGNATTPSGRVLVVEDDQAVRDAVTRALREFLRTFMVKGPDALVHGRVELPFAVETGIYDES